ncbi:hypothetical protein L249_0983 [Ophiocordyceps polyrhachis-furcata BCC 54312]|uniref:Uncharacterized protein n=1 Tax=Ophiocordyceps polyrhachis-furcata BCC 54312 TaxID=1330021 RepID=A0A367LDD9_9HYPO|nr:hypothetical protein L249_0983 [Ophiocordyceps polyrhachis-furcata BCC 54312]
MDGRRHTERDILHKLYRHHLSGSSSQTSNMIKGMRSRSSPKFVLCQYMNYGWQPSFHPSSLSPSRTSLYKSDDWSALDRGAWLLSVLPPTLNVTFTNAYGGTWQELADDLNSALDSITDKITMYQILMWYSRAAEGDDKVCWQTDYSLALERYENPLGALNSLFVDPDTMEDDETYTKRPMDLPPLYLETSALHCLHPDSLLYDQMADLVLGVSAKWPDKKISIEQFREKTDKAAHPFGRALFHAARETYDCPYFDGCSTKNLYGGIPYLAPSFNVFLGTMQSMLIERHHVCITFEEVMGIPSNAYVFASSSYNNGRPRLLAAGCRSKPCYKQFNEALTAGREFCHPYHLEKGLSFFVHADVFSKPTECGKSILILLAEHFSPVCECLRTSSSAVYCARLPCYYELMTGSDYHIDKLKSDCRTGNLSFNRSLAFPYSFSPSKPACGMPMVEFSVDERRLVCECARVRDDEEEMLFQNYYNMSGRMNKRGMSLMRPLG